MNYGELIIIDLVGCVCLVLFPEDYRRIKFKDKINLAAFNKVHIVLYLMEFYKGKLPLYKTLAI
jgi:hypothetical protein